MVNVLDILFRLLQPQNLVLLIVLVLVLVIGFKLIKTLTTLLVVSIVSGAFIVLLNYLNITGLETSITNVLGFMVMGSALYIIYTTLFLTSKVFKKMAKIIGKILGMLLFPLKSGWKKLNEKIDEENKKKVNEETKENQKSVILEESDS